MMMTDAVADGGDDDGELVVKMAVVVVVLVTWPDKKRTASSHINCFAQTSANLQGSTKHVVAQVELLHGGEAA